MKRFRRLILLMTAGGLWVSCSVFTPNRDAVTRTLYFADSIIVQQGDSTVQRIVAGDGTNVYHVEYDKRAIQRRKDSIIITVSAITLFAAVIFLFFYIKKKRASAKRMETELSNDRESIRQMKEEMKEITQKSDFLSNTVQGLLDDKVSLIRSINERYQDVSHSDSNASYMDRLDALQGKIDNMNRYMERLHKKIPLTSEIESALDSTKDGIMQKARQTLGKSIKEDDYLILACIFSGMSPSDISFVTGLAPGTVRTRKSRIKSRINKLAESEEKTRFLSFFEFRKDCNI